MTGRTGHLSNGYRSCRLFDDIRRGQCRSRQRPVASGALDLLSTLRVINFLRRSAELTIELNCHERRSREHVHNRGSEPDTILP